LGKSLKRISADRSW